MGKAVRRIILATILAVPGCAPPKAAQPGPVGEPVAGSNGNWLEQIHWIPMAEPNGTTRLLYTRICRPPLDRKVRVVLINHGSPPNGDDRPKMTPVRCDNEAAQWFLTRGFMVVAPMRRGYGLTGGTWDEGVSRCDEADYVRAGRESARDLEAVIEYVAALPTAQPQAMVVVGQSAGGWATVAYNTLPHPRVSAAISMAGGRGGHYRQTANTNCHPERLVEAAGVFGRSARTPMLWIYTENDSYFDPALARQMARAYDQAGGKLDFAAMGIFGTDGHSLFFGRGGSMIWGPLFERYLATRR